MKRLFVLFCIILIAFLSAFSYGLLKFNRQDGLPGMAVYKESNNSRAETFSTGVDLGITRYGTKPVLSGEWLLVDMFDDTNWKVSSYIFVKHPSGEVVIITLDMTSIKVEAPNLVWNWKEGVCKEPEGGFPPIRAESMQTVRGLAIGDSLQKALSIYGPASIRSANSAPEVGILEYTCDPPEGFSSAKLIITYSHKRIWNVMYTVKY